MSETSRPVTRFEHRTPAPKLQDLIECPHCEETYVDPQLLPCQHSFCNPCINIIKDGTLVECPVCGVTSTLNELRKDINKEQLVAICSEQMDGAESDASVTKDTFSSMESVQAIREESESEVYQNNANNMGEVPICDICEGQIAWHCQQCNQWLCIECQVRHSKTTLTKRHQVESVVDIAKQHRQVLEKQYSILKQAEERLVKTIQRIESEADTTLALKSRVLEESMQLRTDWLEKVNAHFDSIDDKAASFTTDRLNELLRLKKRVENSHNELVTQSNSMRHFLSQLEPYIIAKGREKSRATGVYIKEAYIPKIEIKKTSVNLARGLKWDSQAAASLDIQGGQTVTAVPLSNFLPTHQKDITNKPDQDKVRKVKDRKEKAALQNASQVSLSTSSELSEPNTHRSKDSLRKERKTPAPGRNSTSRLSKLTPIPNATTQGNCFRNLTKSTYRLAHFVKLKTRPVSLHYMKENIWCAQTDAITIWDQDLKPVRAIEHELMIQIQAMKELKSGNIAVACGNGLHLLTKTGRYDARITDECYVDVASRDDMLYAVIYGAKMKAKVHVYDEAKNTERNTDDHWSLYKTFNLPCDGYATINVSDMVIYVCSVDYAVVYVTTLDGEVIRRCGRKGLYGGPGEMWEPRLCHVDFEGSALITDSGNGRVQVLNMEGDWAVASLNSAVTKPSCAYFMKRQLFVAQSEGGFKLFKFIN